MIREAVGSGASIRPRPRLRIRLRALVPIVVLVLAACNGSVPSASPGLGTSDPSTPVGTPATPLPSLDGGPTGSDPVAASETPGEASGGPPDPDPSPEPTPGPTSDATPAAACSGSAANRDFFAAVADSVSWPVYCAVLPAGWFLENGRYRLAAGGSMNVAYRGPGGARLEIVEGNACSDATGCTAATAQLGSARFGDRDGQLVAIDGGYALYVGAGTSPSWRLIGLGLDQAAFVGIAAALARVGD